jgi:hypothetical protein
MRRRSYLQRLVTPAESRAQLFVIPRARSGTDATEPSYSELAARLRQFTEPAAALTATQSETARAASATSAPERADEAETVERSTRRQPQPVSDAFEPMQRPALRDSREAAADPSPLPPVPRMHAPSGASTPVPAGSFHPRTVRHADAQPPQPVEVHIGTLEVRTHAPPQTAARPALPAAKSKAHTAQPMQPNPPRGYGSRFGLGQR